MVLSPLVAVNISLNAGSEMIPDMTPSINSEHLSLRHRTGHTYGRIRTARNPSSQRSTRSTTAAGPSCQRISAAPWRALDTAHVRSWAVWHGDWGGQELSSLQEPGVPQVVFYCARGSGERDRKKRTKARKSVALCILAIDTLHLAFSRSRHRRSTRRCSCPIPPFKLIVVCGDGCCEHRYY